MFQQRVWQVLGQIPIGQTINYTATAWVLRSAKAARVVAGAANILALAVPHHRVVRLDGKLSGFLWGIERKTELLRRESKA